MNKESLKKMREIIIMGLNTKDIDPVDKAELMINLWNFLDDEKYESYIKVLRKDEKKR